MLLLLAAALADPIPLLEGCWQTADGSHQEVWLPARGDVQVGVAIGGTPANPFSEHLSVQTVDGVTSYIADPVGQPVATFPLTSHTPTVAVFEDPAHDFPQRIAYTRTEQGLTVRVDAQDGDARRGFTLELLPCAPPRRAERPRRRDRR